MVVNIYSARESENAKPAEQSAMIECGDAVLKDIDKCSFIRMVETARRIEEMGKT